MGRAKLKMEFIEKAKTRNLTYEKRKQGIIKKAKELKTLCDVDTAVIIYPPNSNTPEIWPENPEEIKKSIAFYKEKDGNRKYKYGLEEYFGQRKKKVEDELVKARKKTMEAKYATWFDELDGLNEVQLRQFAMALENKEHMVRGYLEFKKRMKNIEPVNNYQYGGVPMGLEQVQVVNHPLMNNGTLNNGFGCYDGASTSSFVPIKTEVGGYGYPMFDGGMVYGNPNPWLYQPPVMQMQYGMMPEFAMQQLDPQVNIGVGNFVMDANGGRFMMG